MWNGGSAPSLADIAAVTGNNNGGNNGGWGNDGGIWVLIILFALFGGWGGGWGGSGNGGGGTTVVGADLQRGFDTQSVISKLDGLTNGVSNLGYDQLSQMNNIGTTIMQTGFNLQTAMSQAFNALSTQVADCCCNNKTGQMQIMNQMDKDTCQIVNAINQMGQNIMQNDNANYRSLHEENIQARLDAKDETIAALRSQLERSDYREDNARQTTDILNQFFTRFNAGPGPNWGRSGCDGCGQRSCC